MRDERWRELFTGSAWCEDCQKMGHPSKRAARRARGQTSAAGSLNTYRCKTNSSVWHNGTLPRDVVRGERTRDQITYRKRTR